MFTRVQSFPVKAAGRPSAPAPVILLKFERDSSRSSTNIRKVWWDQSSNKIYVVSAAMMM